MSAVAARARFELLQWFGLFGGAAAWTGQHAALFWLASAHCNPSGSRWGIGVTGWQIAVTVATGTVALAAEAAAIATVLQTQGEEHDGPPPLGRIYFFAVAAAIGNVLFLGAIALDGVGSGYWTGCLPA